MPRKNIPLSAQHPYHVTARCLNKEWFKIPLSKIWSIMEDYLIFINRAYGIKIHSFVLMPNHFHLIVSIPNLNLGQAMNYFMRETSRQINYSSGRINQIYGGRFHRTIIQDSRYYLYAYKYVYRNPVKAGLSKNVENYPFSTLTGLIGNTKIHIPIEEDTLLFSPDLCVQTLDWLNRAPLSTDEQSVKLALRRRIFKLPRDKITKHSNRLEIETF